MPPGLLPDLNTLPLPDLYAHLAATGLPARLFELARDEDLAPFDKRAAPGDATSDAVIDEHHTLAATVTLRAHATVAGLAAVPDILAAFDRAGDIRFQPTANDGDTLPPKTPLATLEGPARLVLAAERTLLNTLSALTGVATLTRAYALAAHQASAGRCSVVDTRKTSPGQRALQKYAVRCGGAKLHRLNLTDAVLIKDNHIAHIPIDQLAAHLASTATAARTARPLRFIEAEVDRLDQLRAVLSIEPGIIDVALLDNMSPEQLRQAVRERDRHAPNLLLEASGGVNIHTIAEIAATGIDRIAVGAITHQATAVDIGLDTGQTAQSSHRTP